MQENFFGRASAKFLFLLLFADFAFVFIHLLYTAHFVSNVLCSIEKDRGYSEIYQYIKEYWIMAMLLILAIKRKQLAYFSWFVLFAYFLLDDSMQIHEKLGAYSAEYFGLQPMLKLRAQDMGELCVSLFFGFVFMAFIAVLYLFSDDIAKKVSRRLFVLVVFLAFFGVLVDMLHVAFPWWMWGLIEDGGEMVMMSIIVWYIFDQWSFYGFSPREIEMPNIAFESEPI